MQHAAVQLCHHAAGVAVLLQRAENIRHMGRVLRNRRTVAVVCIIADMYMADVCGKLLDKRDTVNAGASGLFIVEHQRDIAVQIADHLF